MCIRDSYETDCDHTRGPIAKINILNPGKNYYALPGINTLTTNGGTGAILEAQSNTIGALKSVSIQDIGFGLPSDPTLRPRLLFPQTIRIEPLATFAQVGITSFGRGFSITPKLVVVDGQEEENPMEDLKNYTKKNRKKDKSTVKRSKSIFQLILPS